MEASYKYPNHEMRKQKTEKFIENKKVRQIFRFPYKIAKTQKSFNAIDSLNTWI